MLLDKVDLDTWAYTSNYGRHRPANTANRNYSCFYFVLSVVTNIWNKMSV